MAGREGVSIGKSAWGRAVVPSVTAARARVVWNLLQPWREKILADLEWPMPSKGKASSSFADLMMLKRLMVENWLEDDDPERFGWELAQHTVHWTEAIVVALPVREVHEAASVVDDLRASVSQLDSFGTKSASLLAAVLICRENEREFMMRLGCAIRCAFVGSTRFTHMIRRWCADVVAPCFSDLLTGSVERSTWCPAAREHVVELLSVISGTFFDTVYSSDDVQLREHLSTQVLPSALLTPLIQEGFWPAVSRFLDMQSRSLQEEPQDRIVRLIETARAVRRACDVLGEIVATAVLTSRSLPSNVCTSDSSAPAGVGARGDATLGRDLRVFRAVVSDATERAFDAVVELALERSFEMPHTTEAMEFLSTVVDRCGDNSIPKLAKWMEPEVRSRGLRTGALLTMDSIRSTKFCAALRNDCRLLAMCTRNFATGADATSTLDLYGRCFAGAVGVGAAALVTKLVIDVAAWGEGETSDETYFPHTVMVEILAAAAADSTADDLNRDVVELMQRYLFSKLLDPGQAGSLRTRIQARLESFLARCAPVLGRSATGKLQGIVSGVSTLPRWGGNAGGDDAAVLVDGLVVSSVHARLLPMQLRTVTAAAPPFCSVPAATLIRGASFCALRAALQGIEVQYTAQRPHRRLRWQWLTSTCELRIRFARGTKEVHVTALEGIVLVALASCGAKWSGSSSNEAVPVSTLLHEVVGDGCADARHCVEAVLRDLTTGPYPLLTRSPDGSAVGFNPHFSHARRKLSSLRWGYGSHDAHCASPVMRQTSAEAGLLSCPLQQRSQLETAIFAFIKQGDGHPTSIADLYRQLPPLPFRFDITHTSRAVEALIARGMLTTALPCGASSSRSEPTGWYVRLSDD